MFQSVVGSESFGYSRYNENQARNIFPLAIALYKCHYVLHIKLTCKFQLKLSKKYNIACKNNMIKISKWILWL